jgi:hypothetical protein
LLANWLLGVVQALSRQSALRYPAQTVETDAKEGLMLTLALLTALLILAQPLALIAAFEIAHACYCSLYGEAR